LYGDASSLTVNKGCLCVGGCGLRRGVWRGSPRRAPAHHGNIPAAARARPAGRRARGPAGSPGAPSARGRAFLAARIVKAAACAGTLRIMRKHKDRPRPCLGWAPGVICRMRCDAHGQGPCLAGSGVTRPSACLEYAAQGPCLVGAGFCCCKRCGCCGKRMVWRAGANPARRTASVKVLCAERVATCTGLDLYALRLLQRV